MQYAQIIHEAWELTTKNPKLKWFIFVPSFIAVFIFVIEICWQSYLYLSEFGVIESHLSIKNMSEIIQFLLDNNLLPWIIFAIIFVLFFSFVVPSWVLGSLILSVKHKLNSPEKYLSIRQKLIEGFDYFFLLFEFNAVSGVFSLWSIALFLATFFRYFHNSFFLFLWPLLLIYTIFSFFITIFLSFAPYYIVCENQSLTSSIKKSVSLVFLNFGKTMAIMLLMFLVNFRILINVLIIFGVPFGLLAAMTYFTNSFAIVLSFLLGIALLALTSYLTAIIEVFSTAVWVRVFRDFSIHQKKLEDENL